MGDCCWAKDWVSDCFWAEEVVVVLIWVCSRWRERRGGRRKEERQKLDRGDYFLGYIFYCVDILF